MFLIFSMFLLMGCGGEDSSSNDDFVGIWFDEEKLTLLKVNSTGEVFTYECVYDQYEVMTNISGDVRNNEIYIVSNGPSFEITYQAEFSDNKMNLVSGELSFVLSKLENIPSYCESDWIKITFASPEQANVDTYVTFIINYDYRLSSDSTAIIKLCFTFGEDGSCLLLQENSESVTESGLGSGSLTVNDIPTSIEGSSLYSVSVLMNSTNQETEYLSFAGDRIEITIIE